MCLRSGDGFPDVLVLDHWHNPKFTSEVFLAFVKSMGSCLIVGSAYHKNTNAMFEQANGVISDTLRATPRGARTTGTGSCPSPCSPSTTRLRPWATDSLHSSSTVVHTTACRCRPRRRAALEASHLRATRTGCARWSERTVRELLAAAQQERKAKLDEGRVDTVFQVGYRVLLRTKELLDATDIGKLRPRWDGPFTVTACPPASPNAYTLALPRRMLCSRQSMSIGSSPFTSGSSLLRLRARYRMGGKRESTRWSCCSLATARHSWEVGYTSSSSLGARAVNTLLDAASHGPGGRWHLLVTRVPAGRRPAGPALRRARVGV